MAAAITSTASQQVRLGPFKQRGVLDAACFASDLVNDESKVEQSTELIR